MERPCIVEIGPRSTQGATQPFKCQAEDGKWYWVKGSKVGNDALSKEWIAGRLGQLLGLPIPEIAQVEVAEGLITGSAIPDVADLGSGNRFGSLHVANAQEYDVTHLPLTPDDLRRRVLVFDAWIRNTDRTFTRAFGSSGNPNLLWKVPEGGLFVIDHNSAFLEDDLLHSTGFGNHVFQADRMKLDSVFLNAVAKEMKAALEKLPEIMSELPEQWRFLDEEWAVPSDLTMERLESILLPSLERPDDLLRLLNEHKQTHL